MIKSNPQKYKRLYNARLLPSKLIYLWVILFIAGIISAAWFHSGISGILFFIGFWGYVISMVVTAIISNKGKTMPGYLRLSFRMNNDFMSDSALDLAIRSYEKKPCCALAAVISELRRYRGELTEAEHVLDAAPTRNDRERISLLCNYAILYDITGNYERLISLEDEADRIATAHSGDLDIMTSYYRIAETICKATGQYRLAKEYYDTVMSVYEKNVSSNAENTARAVSGYYSFIKGLTLLRKGEIDYLTGNIPDAAKSMDEAVRLLSPSPFYQDRARSLFMGIQQKCTMNFSQDTQNQELR